MRISTIVFWIFILALIFVFKGEPDLWDVWHAQAMGHCQVAPK